MCVHVCVTLARQRDTKAAKAKRAERRGATRAQAEAKAEKSDAKKDKRQANRKDDEDLDALLAEFRSMQASTTAVREEVVPPPSPRANGTLTVHPSKEELLFYGGERYDGKRNTFYSELFRYSIKRNEWKQVFSPSAPPPRSSHQAVGVIDTVLESSGNDVEVAVETLLSMARLRGRDAGRAVRSWRSYASSRREATATGRRLESESD